MHAFVGSERFEEKQLTQWAGLRGESEEFGSHREAPSHGEAGHGERGGGQKADRRHHEYAPRTLSSQEAVASWQVSATVVGDTLMSAGFSMGGLSKSHAHGPHHLPALPNPREGSRDEGVGVCGDLHVAEG